MNTVAQVLKSNQPTLFSFELLPPPKGQNIHSIFNVIDKLLEFKPANINITYHQEEVVYKKHSNGLLEKKTVRKRPGTVAIAAAIKCRYPKLNVVPHIICGGFTREETEYALIDLNFLDIHNLLVVRGDPPKANKLFKPENNGHAYASELLTQIMDMNKGIYLDDELENTTATRFSVGVAGYPEKHIEAPNLDTDIHYLKEKIAAGAEYIVTQMFFDNKKYFDFVDICRSQGIEVPIIPGLKPIVRKSDLQLLPKTFNIDIPKELSSEILKCKTDKEVYELGIQWCIAQSKELKTHQVPALHYFTIGIADNILSIAKEIF